MGKQIIKQPDGKYCIMSSITDSIIGYDATREEIIESFRKEHLDKFETWTKKELLANMDKLDHGGKPYHQFTESFEDAMVSTLVRYPEEKCFDKFVTPEIKKRIEETLKDREEERRQDEEKHGEGGGGD